MGEITFNDIPVVLDRINKNTTALISAVANMRDELNELKAAADATKAKDDMVCGRFRPSEIIRMNDKQLWEGDGAPFTCRWSVYKAKNEGCPFLSTHGQKSYRIKATDLDRWLNQTALRSKLKL